MKNFNKTKLVVCLGALATVAVLWVATLNAQVVDTTKVWRELLVYFKPGIILIPEGKTGGGLDEITVTSPAVLNALQKYKAEFMEKAFPYFNLVDTLGVSMTGEVVKLANLSHIFKIRLPEGFDPEALGTDLSVLKEKVLFAEPNGMARSTQPVYPNDPYFDDPVNPGQGGIQWNLLNTGQNGGTNDADYVPSGVGKLNSVSFAKPQSGISGISNKISYN